MVGLGEDDDVIIILRWLEKYFYSHSFHIGWAKVGIGGDELGG